MLIRSSRGAEVLTKESFAGVGGLVGKGAGGLLKRLGGDVSSLWKGYKAQKGFIGPRLKGQTVAGETLKGWAPKTLIGKASKMTARSPFATMGAVGGTYMAGSALTGGVRSAMARNADPFALQRRRMQGFRS